MKSLASHLRWLVARISVIAFMLTVVLMFGMLHHLRDRRLSRTP